MRIRIRHQLGALGIALAAAVGIGAGTVVDEIAMLQDELRVELAQTERQVAWVESAALAEGLAARAARILVALDPTGLAAARRETEAAAAALAVRIDAERATLRAPETIRLLDAAERAIELAADAARDAAIEREREIALGAAAPGARAAVQRLQPRVEEVVRALAEIRRLRAAENAAHVAEVNADAARFVDRMQVGAAALVALVVVAFVVIGLRIGRPLRHVAATLGALGRGEDPGTPPISRRSDEVGDLQRAAASLRDGVLHAQRLAQMVDTMPINVMLCDPATGVITYANQETLTTMRRLEAYISVTADQLVGSSIDVFHKHPEHQRRIIADPARLPWKAKVRLGPETLDLRISAIRDHDGAYLGPMLSWAVITRQVALADAFEASVKAVATHVAAAAGQVRSDAESMSAAAEETSRQATSVAASSEQASANVQTVAASSEELAVSIQEISRRIGDAARATDDAVSDADGAGRTIARLDEAAREIGKVIELIAGIAGQTNLLSLNATIEAARAGEAGKGFAVVASEVKALAGQTARASTEVSRRIAEIQDVSRDAIGAIERIGRAIADVSQVAGAIAAAIEQQQAATGEIARNVQQAASGTEGVSRTILGVQAAADQTGRASVTMLDAARDLESQGRALIAEVDRFLGEVRAA